MHWKPVHLPSLIQQGASSSHIFISKVNPFCSIEEYYYMEGLNVKGVTTL